MPLPVKIQNCQHLFRFRCPKRWKNLDPTSDTDVRFCHTCQKQVYLCETLEDIQAHTGQCIAVEDTGYMGEIEDAEVIWAMLDEVNENDLNEDNNSESDDG